MIKNRSLILQKLRSAPGALMSNKLLQKSKTLMSSAEDWLCSLERTWAPVGSETFFVILSSNVRLIAVFDSFCQGASSWIQHLSSAYK